MTTRQDGDGLTRRQRDVIRLVALGFTSKQIAHHLGVSRFTVYRHRTNALDALGVPCTMDLLRAIGWLRVP